MSRDYHCIRVSNEVFERLLKRDSDPSVAVAKMVYTTLSLDDPIEAAVILGYLTTRTANTLTWSANFKTVGQVVAFEGDFKLIKGMGEKGYQEIRRLRKHFDWKNPEVRRRILSEAEDPR